MLKGGEIVPPPEPVKSIEKTQTPVVEQNIVPSQDSVALQNPAIVQYEEEQISAYEESLVGEDEYSTSGSSQNEYGFLFQ